MLTRLRVRNFKSIGDSPDVVNLELKPLTFFVGPNGAGKSTILEALGLLSQSARVGVLALQGPWVAFDPPDMACHKRVVTTPIAIAVEAQIDALVLKPAIDQLDGVLKAEASEHEFAKRKGILARAPHRVEYGLAYSLSTSEILHALGIDGHKLIEARGGAAELHLKESRPVQLGGAIGPTPLTFAYLAAEGAWAPFLASVAKAMHDRISEKVAYVSAERGGRRTVPNDRPLEKPWWVGRRGENTIPCLAHTFGPAGSTESRDAIRHWAQRFGMGDAIAGWVLGSELRFDFTDPSLGVRLDYRAAGFGSQQILPVITALFAAPKGSTLMIEEPEISLHPQGQLDATGMLADAVAYGQQVLVTTHSKIVLMALRKLVAKGQLRADQVAIYEVEKTQAGSKAEKLEVSSKGTIPGWVPTYARAEDELWREWFEGEDAAP